MLGGKSRMRRLGETAKVYKRRTLFHQRTTRMTSIKGPAATCG
jgi:hypothetical protein